MRSAVARVTHCSASVPRASRLAFQRRRRATLSPGLGPHQTTRRSSISPRGKVAATSGKLRSEAEVAPLPIGGRSFLRETNMILINLAVRFKKHRSSSLLEPKINLRAKKNSRRDPSELERDGTSRVMENRISALLHIRVTYTVTLINRSSLRFRSETLRLYEDCVKTRYGFIPLFGDRKITT